MIKEIDVAASTLNHFLHLAGREKAKVAYEFFRHTSRVLRLHPSNLLAQTYDLASGLMIFEECCSSLLPFVVSVGCASAGVKTRRSNRGEAVFAPFRAFCLLSVCLFDFRIRTH